MAWVRLGDTSAFHPIAVKVIEHPEFDDRLLNEVFGWVMRCSAQSGQHSTDYVVSHGTAVTLANPSRASILIEVGLFCGYITVVADNHGSRAYAIVDDPEFIHLRLKEEIEWETQRRRDNSNVANIVRVRLRDGDACRWCGRIVDWSDRKSARAGTYDHLVPGDRNAATVETLVVCCKGCNSSKKDGSRPRGVEQLREEPAEPYYSHKTIEWLRGNDWRERNGLPIPAKPKKIYHPGDLAPGIHPAVTGTATTSTQLDESTRSTTDRPDNQSGSGAAHHHSAADLGHPSGDGPASTVQQRTGTQPVNAPSQPRSESHSENAESPTAPAQKPDPPDIYGKSADPADQHSSGSGSSGRDGSGRVGTGRVGRSSLETVTTSDLDPPSQSDPRTPRKRRRRRPRRTSNTGDLNV